MQYRRLGPTGCKVSVLSLGSWLTYGNTVDQNTTNACVRTAWDGGVNFYDTADVYHRGEAELALAKALKGFRRRDYVLASKAFFPMSENVNDRGLSRKHLQESLHDSLLRLETDYLDLYQCHRFDPETPLEEVVRAMDDFVHQGKILYWGVSFWDAAQIRDVCALADALGAVRPVSNQPPYSLLERGIEREVISACAELGITQIVFSPLAQGLLTGKYKGGKIPKGSRAADERAGSFLRPKLTDRNLKLASQVADVAARAGVTPAELALAWVLSNSNVSSAIVGASRPEQVRENLKAVDLPLDAEVKRTLDRLTTPTEKE